MSFSDRDHQYMQQAMELAKESAIDEEVPVGAVLRFENGETFVSGNHREKNGNVLGHCEAVVIQEASKLRGSWRLDKSVLYVTLEPCLSCTGLIYASRISEVIYGCKSPKGGALEFIESHRKSLGLNHKPKIRGGLLESEVSAMMKEFFQVRRA